MANCGFVAGKTCPNWVACGTFGCEKLKKKAGKGNTNKGKEKKEKSK